LRQVEINQRVQKALPYYASFDLSKLKGDLNNQEEQKKDSSDEGEGLNSEIYINP
jgi:hypothetical protein